jgi:hypothetical protein
MAGRTFLASWQLFATQGRGRPTFYTPRLTHTTELAGMAEAEFTGTFFVLSVHRSRRAAAGPIRTLLPGN